MPLVSSECIILRNQDYLERDRLVTFLTRDAGRVRGIVKGSRKLTSRGVGSFEVFSRGVMHWVDKGREGLVTIRKCDPLPPYLYLHGGYHAFLYAGYFAELA
nr:DNA repair protein RecO [Gammaproteobacteria bacterium]NIR97788.1 DNA repair protein RecO [Gammaproteobacteria bacterium]NIT63840.1 DNA repair protein RecO [Gammaproteobacteria bacterium]NIV20810.1 DNA repair protein RecO [Gammaproteobacteria bacterium]NIY32420.1 DNA repair protein RecO [Gammaproteobacteria bacterium]